MDGWADYEDIRDPGHTPRDDRVALLGLALAGLLLTPLCWLCGLLCQLADWGRR